MNVIRNGHGILVRTEHGVMQTLVKHTVDEGACETRCRRKLEDNLSLTREWWKCLARDMVYWQVLMFVLHPDCNVLTS
jgi:hypothetical protein